MISDITELPCSSFSSGDVDDVVITAKGTAFTWNGVTVHAPVGGAFTTMNLLAAVTTVKTAGYLPVDIARACEDIRPIRGRFELVPGANDFDVVVDYAHTPEGLEEVLKTARALTTGRLITTFGCGGNRDHDKRPVMGRIAADIADVVIITSDNPRDENPVDIISQVSEGVANRRAQVNSIIDRREAIETAIEMASSGDIVVIAGKGHETTQEIAGVRTPFDDVCVAKEVLQKKTGDKR